MIRLERLSLLAVVLSNGRWLKRAPEAVRKRDKTNLGLRHEYPLSSGDLPASGHNWRTIGFGKPSLAKKSPSARIICPTRKRHALRSSPPLQVRQ